MSDATGGLKMAVHTEEDRLWSLYESWLEAAQQASVEGDATADRECMSKANEYLRQLNALRAAKSDSQS